MVHWIWLLASLLAGSIFGYMMAGMLFSSLDRYPPIDDVQER